MKKIISILLSAAIALCFAASALSDEPEEAPADISENIAEEPSENTQPDEIKSPFSDVPSEHTNFEAIMKLSEMGVISGKGDGLFCPDDEITRAEFVKIICTAAELKINPDVEPKKFSDTQEHWAKDYIEIAYTNGLISGTGENEFSPDNKVTYQQISKICVNLIGLEELALATGGYPKGYIEVMVNNSVFFGSTVFSTVMQNSDYYAKNAIRSDVAQTVFNMVNNKMLPSCAEEIEGLPQNESELTVNDDLGEGLSEYQNPSVQQIFNVVYDSLLEKEVTDKVSTLSFSVMAMIFTESGGKHYDGRSIYKNGTRYGICGLDAEKYDSKNLSWKENLELGIKEYSVIYWSLLKIDGEGIAYDDSVNKAVLDDKAESFEEACARTAYSIYRGGPENRESWFTDPTNDDERFYKIYTEREWTDRLDELPEEVDILDTEETDTTQHSDKLDYTLFDTLLPSQKYVKQSMNDSCTLASMTMLFRLRAIYDCNENYKMITEASMIQQGNWPNGLTYVPQFHSTSANLHMKGIVKIWNYGPQETIDSLKETLDAHPEGIVLYVYSSNGSWRHAVVLTRYDGNNFYCLDPANSTPYGEINLLNSAICDSRHAAQRASLNNLFKNNVKIWYITSH